MMKLEVFRRVGRGLGLERDWRLRGVKEGWRSMDCLRVSVSRWLLGSELLTIVRDSRLPPWSIRFRRTLHRGCETSSSNNSFLLFRWFNNRSSIYYNSSRKFLVAHRRSSLLLFLHFLASTNARSPLACRTPTSNPSPFPKSSHLLLHRRLMELGEWEEEEEKGRRGILTCCFGTGLMVRRWGSSIVQFFFFS